MTKKHLINNQVIHDFDASCLFSNSLPSVKVALHAPVNKCLLLLIQNKGKILSQKFLYDNIWGHHGNDVTPNTLYQNVSILRKCLKSAGVVEDCIQTLPKTGIIFIGEAVLYDSAHKPFAVSQRTPYSSDTHLISETVKYENNKSGVVDTVKTASVPVSGEAAKPIKNKLTVHKSILYSICTIVFIGLTTVLYLRERPEKPFFMDYKLAGNINGCILNSSYYNNEIAMREFKAYSKISDIKCYKNFYAYLTIIKFRGVSSVLVCNQPAENKNAQCLNHIFLDYKNGN